MNIPIEHFNVLRKFTFGDPDAFNHLYNKLVKMYEKAYKKNGVTYTLKDASPIALRLALETLKQHKLFESLSAEILLRPILLPISNEVSITTEISPNVYALMLKTNNVITSASTRLVRDGETFSMSDNTIVHTNIKLKNKVVGGYIKAQLSNGETKITLATKEKLDEIIYRTDHLCYGGLISLVTEKKSLHNAMLFAFLSDMTFSLSSLNKTSLLHRINSLQSINSQLYLQRQRMDAQARFLQSAKSGSHDRVMLKINQYNLATTSI
jgi:hypothetical protein